MQLILDKAEIPTHLLEYFKPANQRCGECHVCVIVDVFRLVRELLAEDGTCWVNYGDSYAGSVKGYPSMDVDRASTYMNNYKMGGFPKSYKAPPGLKPKDLVGMPWRIALALQSDGWWLRSDIIWSKANPMPESVTDRPTRSHEYLFLLAKKSRYFYDAEAVREPGKNQEDDLRRIMGDRSKRYSQEAQEARNCGPLRGGTNYTPADGRNRRTVWNIATEAYSQAHFATFPRKLVEPCVLAGTSSYGHCPAIIDGKECGARWVRVAEDAPEYAALKESRRGNEDYESRGLEAGNRFGSVTPGISATRTTTGWCPTCSHDLEPIPDVVLDCFGGSGTVGLVAEQLGRKYILIELNPEYSKLAREDTKQEVMRL